MEQSTSYFEERKKSPVLSEWSTKNWLQKRYNQKAKLEYVQTREQIKRDQIIEELFNKFDEDGSGSLDADEILELFEQNEIYIDKHCLKEIFDTVEKDSSGALNLQSFKQLSIQEQSQKVFRQVMAKIRNKFENQEKYIPYNFDAMMKLLNHKGSREDIQASITKPQDLKDPYLAEQDTQRFIDLFHSHDELQPQGNTMQMLGSLNNTSIMRLATLSSQKEIHSPEPFSAHVPSMQTPSILKEVASIPSQKFLRIPEEGSPQQRSFYESNQKFYKPSPRLTKDEKDELNSQRYKMLIAKLEQQKKDKHDQPKEIDQMIKEAKKNGREKAKKEFGDLIMSQFQTKTSYLNDPDSQFIITSNNSSQRSSPHRKFPKIQRAGAHQRMKTFALDATKNNKFGSLFLSPPPSRPQQTHIPKLKLASNQTSVTKLEGTSYKTNKSPETPVSMSTSLVYQSYNKPIHIFPPTQQSLIPHLYPSSHNTSLTTGIPSAANTGQEITLRISRLRPDHNLPDIRSPLSPKKTAFKQAKNKVSNHLSLQQKGQRDIGQPEKRFHPNIINVAAPLKIQGVNERKKLLKQIEKRVNEQDKINQSYQY